MLAAVLLATATLLPQQADARYELGWRLKALESAWMGERDVAVRARLLGHWRDATRGFFEGRTGEAARALDAARGGLAGGAAAWCDALALVPEARLLDARRDELELVLEAVYDAPRPERFELGLAGSAWRQTVERLPWRGTVPIATGAGARVLVFEFDGGAHGRGRRELCWSAVEELEERLVELAAALARVPRPDTLASATARGLLQLLEELAWEPAGETDLPAAKLLSQAEACLAAAASGARWPEPAPGAELHLWVPLGDARLPIRLRAPSAPADGPRALVLALHGAGGSENLFFEGYGAGAIVALCEARGWILVAPRLAPVEPFDAAALVDALAAFLPVDRGRVFLVGHSMGAMQASAALNAAPGLARAAALLAGAGGIRAPAAWRELPVFLAAGEHDFGRRGVESMHEALLSQGAQRAVYRSYANTEHLTVVGEALPDVFAFFDEAAGE